MAASSIDKIVEEELKLAHTRIDEELKLRKRRIEEELELTRTRIDEEFRLTETRVQEIWKLTETKLVSRIKSFVEDGNQSSAQKSLKLQFRNKISQPILTGEEIKGEEHTPMEVILVDAYTGDIVDVGPEASANVEIVARRAKPDDCEADAESTHEEYKPLLAGNISLKLQKGMSTLDNIKFRHYASKIKPSVFRLEARLVDKFSGARVMDAKTESFLVKDFREKYNKKHATPSLSDEVWRLNNIRKGGKINDRLKGLKIHTVEEFLVQLLINPEGLKRTVNMVAKKWDVTVNHARATPCAHKMYCYINSKQKKSIVFNLLGKVLGLYLKGRYLRADELSENHEDDVNKLKVCALEHWDHIIPFIDGNALEQHLSILNSDYSGGSDKTTVASEVVGESSNRSLNSSFLHYSRETGIEYIAPVTIGDAEMRDDFSWELILDPSFNAQSMLEVLDMDFQNDSGGTLDKDEPNMNQERAESGIMLVESQIIPLCKATKRWRKLFCVTMWFLVMKGASKGCRHAKKQRVS